MKRTPMFFIFFAIVCLQTFSEDIKGIEHGNMQMGLSSHTLQLMDESKATPVYAEVKYKLYDGVGAIPYVRGNMGYSYISDDTAPTTGITNMTDSRYYSVGAGVEISDLSLEVAYENYQIDPVEDESDGRMVLKFDYKY
ncbi:hypothetical protein [uncultured Ilyobacter sp.]|uniref:hypothetical protein n=1 Tax=uncultured Ilyobacter sp. TaxID=544433 RepID=UPI0029C8F766|nr:hypothetical protein [uncultured Ilyobacter sp.]